MKKQSVLQDFQKNFRLHATPIVQHKRLILIEYAGETRSRASTIEGALKAVIIRIAHGQYVSAVIYDERFGLARQPALKIEMHRNGIAITWTRTPKWKTND